MDQVIEELAIALAFSKDKQALKLTSEQQALGIQPQLIYIAGLVLYKQTSLSSTNTAAAASSATTIFSSTLQDYFLELQKLYNESMNSATTGTTEIQASNQRVFHLSPRLVPNVEQQRIIDKDITAKMKVMERQADDSAKELLKHEEKLKVSSSASNKEVSSKSTVGKKRTKMKNSEKELKEIKQDTNRISHGSETLADLINTHIEISHDNSCDESGSWISVQRKGKKNNEKEIEIHKSRREDIIVSNERMKTLNIPAKQNTADEVTKFQNVTTTFNHQAVEKHQDIITSTCDDRLEEKIRSAILLESSIGDHSNEIIKENNSTTLSQERERIRELEAQLLQKNQQLEIERKEHAKQLRKEKERYEDQRQALQMRLYISETRLKIYEDALNQHVETVSNNVSNAYTPLSPKSKGSIVHDLPSSSPLISSVLKKQNRLA